MNEKEVNEIYDLLLRRTKADKLEWKEADQKGVYEVNFPRSSVRLSREYSQEHHFESEIMGVYNDNGDQVAVAAQSIGGFNFPITTKTFDRNVSELFHEVESRVYKYSETSKDILRSLRRLG